MPQLLLVLPHQYHRGPEAYPCQSLHWPLMSCQQCRQRFLQRLQEVVLEEEKGNERLCCGAAVVLPGLAAVVVL